MSSVLADTHKLANVCTYMYKHTYFVDSLLSIEIGPIML